MNDAGTRPWMLIGGGIVAVALMSAAIAVSQGASRDRAIVESRGAGGDKASEATPVERAKPARKAFEMPTCGSAVTASKAGTEVSGSPAARRAAQRGLDFLASSARTWQEVNDCYGCHVQAVTLEAFAVGRHNQYEVTEESVKTILDGMLYLKGGARHATGLGYAHGGKGDMIYDAGKIFGVAAFARYDQWVAGDLEKELLVEAEKVLAKQQTNGEVTMPYNNQPVSIGTIQGTAQAIVAWKQAYERSADDQWLTGVSRAEDYLHGVVAGWKTAFPANIQEVNYALIGLIAAGVGAGENVMVKLERHLLERQNQDGGWSLVQGGASQAYATGQTLYVLRLLGMTDAEPAMARATGWLVEHQAANGGWSEAGFGKAEAMWGVLGLVSVDVLTVTVAGIKDGQHVTGEQLIRAEARDNKGGGVVQVEVDIDDIPAYGTCGAELSYNWDTKDLEQGKHIVDVRATNAKGEVSRRRLEVFAGDVYLTQLGSRYTDGGTEISLRDIAEPDKRHTVSVEIYSAEQKGGKPSPNAKLTVMEQAGSQGAMRFFWDGRAQDGKQQPVGEYVARLIMKDQTGRALQTEELVFVHDTPEAQYAAYGQVQGALALPDGDAANALVELVDEKGNVVQQTRSTGKGKYRFRNVKADRQYKVRVSKAGFAAPAKEVNPAAAEESQVDLQLLAE